MKVRLGQVHSVAGQTVRCRAGGYRQGRQLDAGQAVPSAYTTSYYIYKYKNFLSGSEKSDVW